MAEDRRHADAGPAPAAGASARPEQAELDALFDRTERLAAQPRSVQELPGGLTNHNYKVTTPDGTFVARVSDAGGDLLAIDRDAEYRNSVAAAAAGAGAPVIEYRPQDSLLVVGYIEGRTFGNADVAAPGNIARIAQACRRLHSGAAVRQRLRHVRHPAPVPVGRPVPRLPDPGRIRRPDAAVRGGRRRPGRPRTPAPSRATTTCWPPTSSTTGTASG